MTFWWRLWWNIRWALAFDFETAHELFMEWYDKMGEELDRLEKKIRALPKKGEGE